MNARPSVAFAVAVGTLALVSRAHAGTAVDWSSAVEITAPVDALSSGPGASVLWAFDRWNLVYEAGGEIYLVSSTDGTTWSAPEQISNDPAASTLPQLASLVDLHVVWEDTRTGGPVWTRRWDGTTWTAEECLSCQTADRSANPSISSDDVYVVWEEGPEGASAIVGRDFTTSWQAVELISHSTGSASAPSVASTDGITNSLRAAWIDTRDGGGDVYVVERGFGPWMAERRMRSPAPSTCRRRSSSRPAARSTW